MLLYLILQAISCEQLNFKVLFLMNIVLNFR